MYDLAPPVFLGQRQRTRGWSAWARWRASASKLMLCLAHILGLGLLLRIASQVDSVSLFVQSFSLQHSSIPRLASPCGLIAPTILTRAIVLVSLCNSTAVLLDQLESTATLRFPAQSFLTSIAGTLPTTTLYLWVIRHLHKVSGLPLNWIIINTSILHSNFTPFELTIS